MRRHPVWENIRCPSPSVFVHSSLFPHCLRRNYGVTAEDKAPTAKREGFLALLLQNFVSSFASQCFTLYFNGASLPLLRLTQEWAWCWSELAGVVCSVLALLFPSGLTRSECFLPRRCFRALKSSSICFSPSWMLHQQKWIAFGALASIFYWQMRAWDNMAWQWAHSWYGWVWK